MWWGVCCFESRVAKMGGGSTFFIKYCLIIEYICNFFAFLGWFRKIFFSKFSSAQSIWGGRTLSTCILGGSTFFNKYGLIIEYICKFFAFLGWFHKIFFSKSSPAQSIWGGCTLSTCILGGVHMGSAENVGGKHPAAEGHKVGTPPPLDVSYTFPNLRDINP